jgi:hypothetical protein
VHVRTSRGAPRKGTGTATHRLHLSCRYSVSHLTLALAHDLQALISRSRAGLLLIPVEGFPMPQRGLADACEDSVLLAVGSMCRSGLRGYNWQRAEKGSRRPQQAEPQSLKLGALCRILSPGDVRGRVRWRAERVPVNGSADPQISDTVEDAAIAAREVSWPCLAVHSSLSLV